MTYEYKSILQSDLSSKTILMLGRGQAKKKRFQIGIIAMEYIVEVIPKSNLKIISNLRGVSHLQNLIINLNLLEYINFVGYNINPDIYFKNSSLNIFPSISEAFPMVILETKLYGIPNILLGLDYIAMAKGGNIIIYDDSPLSLAKEAIKILSNIPFRKKLSLEARKSMKIFHNKNLIINWIKLILSIYNGDKYYQKLREKYFFNYEKNNLNIINNQINLFKKRVLFLNNITRNDYENFSFMENIN